MAAKGAKTKAAAKKRKRTRKHTPTRRAVLGKILRIGIIQSGRIVEERLIPAETAVTVGDHPKCTVVISGAQLPSKRFELFANRGGKYCLQFTEKMHGKVAQAGEISTLASLASTGKAAKKGSWFSFPLAEDNRGKVYVGDYTVLFQFVTPPPQPARRRSADFRPFRWEEVDWLFLGVLFVSALLHTATVIWIESQPPPKEWSIEDIPARFVKLVIPEEEKDEPVEEESDAEGEGDKEDAKEDESAEEEPEEAPAEKAPEPQETAEERRARQEALVQSSGLLAILGTMGTSSSGDAVADLLSDGLSSDAGSALANSTGLAVGRRDDAGSGLRSGGGPGGAASIGDLGGTGGGGAGGSLQKKQKKLKAKIQTGAADFGTASQGDTKSIKKILKRYTGQVKACYERQLKNDPDLGGKVTVSFVIQTNGKVADAEILVNTTDNVPLENCILKVIRKIRVSGDLEEDIAVESYPFIFSAG
jgi:outer membrane biosynthesis protein TonB